MSKSILILDTPKTCSECKLFNDELHIYVMCMATRKTKNYKFNGYKNIMSDCPLITMPEKQVHEDLYDEYGDGWDDGWNSCIYHLENAGKSRVLERKNGNETGVS